MKPPTPNQIVQPDYPGLVRLLPYFHSLVDATGVVTLEPHEADRIRTLGFDAEAGSWHVPCLPRHLVEGNPLLEPLADDIDSFWKPSPSATVEVAHATINREHSAETRVTAAVAVPSANAEGGNPIPTASLRDVPQAKTLPDQSAERALEKECTSVLAAVERAGGSIPKRLLQKKLWRIPADHLNQAIRSLVEQDSIRVQGNILIASQTENVTAVTKDGGI